MATQYSQSNKSVAIPSYTLLMNFSKTAPVVYPEICFNTSLKHVANNFKIGTMAAKMETQWSKCNQSVAISNNTLLMNFTKLAKLVSSNLVYEPKTCCQQTGQLGGGNLATI